MGSATFADIASFSRNDLREVVLVPLDHFNRPLQNRYAVSTCFFLSIALLEGLCHCEPIECVLQHNYRQYPDDRQS